MQRTSPYATKPPSTPMSSPAASHLEAFFGDGFSTMTVGTESMGNAFCMVFVKLIESDKPCTHLSRLAGFALRSGCSHRCILWGRGILVSLAGRHTADRTKSRRCRNG